MVEEITPLKFAFLVMPDFPMACLTSAIEPLRAANEISQKSIFEWQVVGETKQVVQCSAHVNFEPDLCLEELQACRGIYILGSPTSVFQNESQANGKLRALARKGVTIGAFSGGVFALARSGLLDGRHCSVHWVYEGAFKERFPGVMASDRVMVRDTNCETASGAAAVFDLMLAHIASALDAATVTEVACWFQHPFVRGSEAAQLVPTKRTDSTLDELPNIVKSAIEIFSNHIADPVKMADVATSVGISPRQLDRIFQTATGMGPLKYYTMMRMEQARQLVLYSSEPVFDIALAIGYSSSEPLVKNYRRAFGMTPSQHRQIGQKFNQI